MKCKNCKVSAFNKPLFRTEPKGQTDAGWMCKDCIKIKEPELYRNFKDDSVLKLTDDIIKNKK